MDELKAKLAQLEEDIRMAKHRGEFAAAQTMEEEAAKIQYQIEQMSQEAQQQEIVDSVLDENSGYAISAGGYEADFRALAAGETEYQILAITTQMYIADIEAKHASVLQALKDGYEAQLAQVKDELSQTQADLSDVRSKLDAATTEITNITLERDTAVSEKKALAAQVEELSKQSHATTYASNIDGSEKLKELNAKLEASRIPVYDVVAGDLKTSFYRAKLAETGEEIEIRPHYLIKSKYREVTAEEAATFRAQAEAETVAAMESVPEADSTDSGVAIPPTAFQGDSTDTMGESEGVAGDAVVSESVSDDATRVTRKEFEELKARVVWLETLSNHVA